MKTVHLIESFEDLVKAFLGCRGQDDTVPMMDEHAKLTIESDGHMILRSERFALVHGIKYEGVTFIEWCVEQKIHGVGKRVNIKDVFK